VAEVPVSGSSWDEFVKVKANVSLPAGEHIMRFTVTGDWFDIDNINFVAGKDAEDVEPEETDAISGKVKLASASVAKFDVFDLKGSKIASFTARNMAEASKLWSNGSVKGAEKASGVCLIRNRANGMIAKVRATR
jgi:hypothetical protein